MAKQPVPTPESDVPTRAERVVAYMFIAILGLSLIAVFAYLIFGTSASGPVWAAIALEPLIGFPISIIMVLVLLILTTRRRAKSASGAGK